MPEDREIRLRVEPANANLRLDIFLSERLPGCSRTSAARWLKSGVLRVDGEAVKPSYRLNGNEVIEGLVPEPTQLVAVPQAIDLSILYEDRDIIVINKAAGMVVHPAPGHPDGTLVNALLFHCGDLSGPDGDIRPGIVHRLDKETSGVLVVAKNEISQRRLAEQFKARRTRKQYRAIVLGNPKLDSGSCDASIGRHPTDRKRMSIHSRNNREALTLWKVRKRWNHFSELELEIRTGRTHQIRVHCAAMGNPVLGDEVYGPSMAGIQKSGRWPGPEAAKNWVYRQLLHAERLALTHPRTGQALCFSAPLPEDYLGVQSYLSMNGG
jgi:23S rRNA pseudouridine1911/1915/1917 synthase